VARPWDAAAEAAREWLAGAFAAVAEVEAGVEVEADARARGGWSVEVTRCAPHACRCRRYALVTLSATYSGTLE